MRYLSAAIGALAVAAVTIPAHAEWRHVYVAPHVVVVPHHGWNGGWHGGWNGGWNGAWGVPWSVPYAYGAPPPAVYAPPYTYWRGY